MEFSLHVSEISVEIGHRRTTPLCKRFLCLNITYMAELLNSYIMPDNIHIIDIYGSGFLACSLKTNSVYYSSWQSVFII